ncbi:hypothetical protein M758_12G027400 [Ceratodon purpureus]|nr:hypothetical protein M758_12G027400 [Ceratodon purpureus]
MAINILKATLSRFFNREAVAEVDTDVDCPLASAETPELYLRLTANCTEQVDLMIKVPTSPKFNHEQCGYLAEKLRRAVRSAYLFFEQINTWYSTVASPEDRARSLEIFKLLFALGKEVENYIQDCSKDAWIQSAILLANVSDNILSLGFDLEYCTIVFSNRKRFGALPCLSLTEVTALRAAEAETIVAKFNPDQLRLKRDVSALIECSKSSSIEWELATFLHERLDNPRMHLGDASLQLNQGNRLEIFGKGLKQMESLGSGACGTVYRASWLGAEVAKKTFHGPSDPDFWKEVSILDGLCHPNIVSLLWYTTDERKCYIIMELMDGDLYALIHQRLENCEIGDPPFSIREAVHIILQVAEGMLFLHGNRIVHRDLKSKNILVRRVKSAEVDVKFVHVKVTDFGLSRTKERSMTASIQTLNMGTTRWMPPEMIRVGNDDGEGVMSDSKVQLKYPFKSDVYSFGMVCYEILTGNVPFSMIGLKEVKSKVLGGVRPQLPDGCPDRLKALIEACWSSEPSRRPRFDDICAELRHLKCELFMESAYSKAPKAPRCFSLDEVIRMTKDFSEENVLSWEAHTMVYKGVMIDTGEEVAVQRIFEKYVQDLGEFNTQVESLSGLHHHNLVGYVGFCYAKHETIHVFEYMPNGSLDKWLSEDAGKANMNWPLRRNICLGVANGIQYLHSVAEPRVIHRNINASNILLDHTLEPKITGFRYALLVSKDGSEMQQLQQCFGTQGCGSAECFDNLGQTSESWFDVYCFGALLFEIVSGRRNGDPKLPEDHLNLEEWAQILYSDEDRVNQLIDPILNLQQDEGTEAIRILKIALLCVHTVVETRPDMPVIHSMLQGNLDQEISRLLFEHEKERFGILVKTSKSENRVCRQQAASKLRNLVAGKRNLIALKEAGGIAALTALLEDLDQNGQKDVLVALHSLPPEIAIPVDQLPLQIVLKFLSEIWPIHVRNAAAGLLGLMVNDEAVCTDIFINRNEALGAKLNLLFEIPDGLFGLRLISGLLKMVKTISHQKRNKFKEVLIDMIILLCRSGETCQEAVIKADGHSFLLASLQEISIDLKEKAAECLLELIKNTKSRQYVLEAGFVTAAMRSINARFACTDIALGLDLISATSTGLRHIYSDSQSVSALLSLLNYCHEPKGKDAAASVIARLYPRLNRQEDLLARQRKIAESCGLFFRCLDFSDISHCKGFLEALAAIATDMMGTVFIFEVRGHRLLMKNLSDFTLPHDIQGLILKILAEMSSHVQDSHRLAKKIPQTFVEDGIASKLIIFFKSYESDSRTESVKNALILIINLSLAGSDVCEDLIQQGVTVPLLLEVLKRHESHLSVLTELAVKALEKFLDDPQGKQAFLRGGGIQSLAAVLKLDVFQQTGHAKSFSTRILMEVAKDPQTRKVACETIFGCDILSALNEILFNGETRGVKRQVAVLMKLLAMYGPTKQVCSTMKAKGCLDALIALRTVHHCTETANDVLRFVSEKSRDCKRYIDLGISNVG